ncbi:MAG TPA: glycosyltransferase family 2 protein [Gemmatimonadales bacterium]|nr:glycosyltransferase family 2 protein [Gemmatimonadales bacterium]
MPTALLDLDAERLPDEIALPARYGHALVLFRWKGKPVGQVTLAVRDGRISGDRIREALAERPEPILQQWLDDYLECDLRRAVPVLPATVAVCTRDRPADLSRCLVALSRLRDQGQEIVVVDSASRGDETRQVVAQFPQARYVREDRPGLDIARNRAMREARHPIVAFTDDDAEPDPDWLSQLIQGFGDRRVLAVTGLTMPLELETEAQEWFERTNGFGRGFKRVVYQGTRQNPFLVARIGAGVNMALRREAIDLVGPFDEALDAGTPTRSGGDHDMFTRILMAGYSIVYQPAALNRHRHRREWEGLRDTIYGYGVGVYAHLTGHLLRNREPRAVLLALGWLREQIPSLFRAWLRCPGHVPLDLVLAELRGCAAGPKAYLTSRRVLAQRGREVG